jgi:site-specific recombinase XerD
MRASMSHLSPAESLAVLRIARARSMRDWAMILVLYRHGLRSSEISGPKLNDVNLRDGSKNMTPMLHTTGEQAAVVGFSPALQVWIAKHKNRHRSLLSLATSSPAF